MDHVTAEQIDGFLSQQLEANQLLSIDEHLESCNLCRKSITEVSKLKPSDLISSLALNELEETDHLFVSEQLIAYLDNSIDDINREIVESHIQGCPSCAAELNDLRAFKHTIDNEVVIKGDGNRIKRFRLPATVAATLALAFCFIALYKLQDKEELVATSPESYSQTSPQVIDTEPVASPTVETAASAKRPSVATRPQRETRTVAAIRPKVLDELNGRPVTLLGKTERASSFKVLQPVGTVLLSNIPHFRWQEISGAESYTVSVFDEGFREVLRSEPLRKAEWKSAKPLEHGKTYTWQVTAIVDGKEIVAPSLPSPEARFKVIESKKKESFNRSKDTSSLSRAHQYMREGLIDEAETELKSYLRENPNSKEATRLLNTLHSWRQR
jgi:hypothetical protein